MRVLSAISSPAQDDVIGRILRCRNQWDPPRERQRLPRGPSPQLEILEDCPGVQDEDCPEVPVWNPEDDNQDPPGDWWRE